MNARERMDARERLDARERMISVLEWTCVVWADGRACNIAGQAHVFGR